MCAAFAAQLLSCVQLSATPWAAEHQAPISSAVSQTLLELVSIDSEMLPDHLIYYLLIFFSFFLQLYPVSRKYV